MQEIRRNTASTNQEQTLSYPALETAYENDFGSAIKRVVFENGGILAKGFLVRGRSAAHRLLDR